ncbi:hypothetical protein B0H13DRAFT_1477336, partial [Mycena leptocephala]
PRRLPEVIPGPGLPTLASLNLTSGELYRRVPALDEMKRIEPLFDLTCGQSVACPVANAVACFNFLNALGTQLCTINGDFGTVIFCSSGPCDWGGTNISGDESVSSFCRDVAVGGNTVINTCQGNGFVDGSNAANGNGGLIVTISEF